MKAILNRLAVWVGMAVLTGAGTTIVIYVLLWLTLGLMASTGPSETFGAPTMDVSPLAWRIAFPVGSVLGLIFATGAAVFGPSSSAGPTTLPVPKPTVRAIRALEPASASPGPTPVTRRPTALVYRARTASGRRIEVGADTDAEAPGHFSFTDPDPMVELTVRIPRGTERIVYPPAGTGGAALDPLEPATVGVLPTPTQIPDRVPDLPRSAQVGHPTATSSRPPGATANFVEPIPAGTRRYKVFLADAKELGEYHVMYAPDDETLMARFNSRGRHGVPVPTYIADITVPGARRHVYPPRG